MKTGSTGAKTSQIIFFILILLLTLVSQLSLPNHHARANIGENAITIQRIATLIISTTANMIRGTISISPIIDLSINSKKKLIHVAASAEPTAVV